MSQVHGELQRLAGGPALPQSASRPEQLSNIETIVGKVDDPPFPKGARDMAIR